MAGIFEQAQFQNPNPVIAPVPTDITKKVNLVDSEGKFVGSANESDLPHFLSQGYHVENAQQKEVNDYLEQNKGLGGALKAGAYSAANELTFGALNPVVEGTADQSTVAKIKGLQRQHNIASAIGTGAGLAGSLAFGGPLFKGAAEAGRLAEGAVLGERAAEAGLGIKALSGAIKMGTEGAVLAAPQALTEAAFGDPQEAAEHLLYGLGAGAVLGGLSPVIKGAGKVVANAVGKPAGINFDESLLKNIDNMTLNQTKRSYMYGTDKYAGELLDKNIDKEALELIKEKGLYKKIGSDFNELQPRIQSELNKTGSEIGNLYKSMEDNGATIGSFSELKEKIEKDVINPLKKSAANAKDVKIVEKYINDLENSVKFINEEKAVSKGWVGVPEEEIGNIPLTPTELWDQRKALDKLVFDANRAAKLGNLDSGGEALAKVRNILQNELEVKGEEAAKKVGSEFIPQLKKLNKEYKVLSTLDEVTDRSIASEQSRRNFSLSDHLVGLGGLSYSNAITNPLGAGLGFASGIANKFLRENGNTMLAKYGNNVSLFLSDMAKQEAEGQLGRIPTILKQFANNTFSSGGVQETGNAISRFIGSQEKDPVKAYSELSNKLQQANVNDMEINHVLNNGTPNISTAYQQQNNNVINYLKQTIPQDPNAGQPFAKPFKPSKPQLKSLNDKLEVINNPFIVMDKLGNGSLNQNHMEALKAIYPKIYNNMVNKINEYGMSKPDMPYKQKLRLSMLTGSNLDPSLNNISNYQALYEPEEEQSKPIAKGKLDKLPGADYTQNQRITS